MPEKDLKQKRKPIIGMRMIKTVIAVALAAYLMEYVFHQTAFFACIGAVVAVESSIARSIKAALIRNIGTVTGGAIGILIASFTENILLISLGVIPLILLNSRLKKQESIIPGMIVYFAVAYLNTMDQAWVYGVKRMIGTLVGTLLGLAVNLLFFPPKGEEALATPEQADIGQG